MTRFLLSVSALAILAPKAIMPMVKAIDFSGGVLAPVKPSKTCETVSPSEWANSEMRVQSDMLPIYRIQQKKKGLSLFAPIIQSTKNRGVNIKPLRQAPLHFAKSNAIRT